MEKNELNTLIFECRKNNSSAQRKLFDYMYNYGMTVASRYGYTLAESEDIANEGFYKALKHIAKYDVNTPFLLWVRRIIINCAIDVYRKSQKRPNEIPIERKIVLNEGMTKLDSAYLLGLIRNLSPKYKMVFVLHTIDGYTHEEIAKKLNISKGTSKSNLVKARRKLQEMVSKHNKIYDHVRKG